MINSEALVFLVLISSCNALIHLRKVYFYLPWAYFLFSFGLNVINDVVILIVCPSCLHLIFIKALFENIYDYTLHAWMWSKDVWNIKITDAGCHWSYTADEPLLGAADQND